MQKYKNIFLLFSIVIILIATGVVIIGLNPSLSRQDAENEIASFMMELLVKQGPVGVETPSDYIYVQEEIKSPIENIETSNQPWLNASEPTTIIVWAPPLDNLEVVDYSFNMLRMDDPISVWWYFDHTLVTASDKTAAIVKYREMFMSGGDVEVFGCPHNFSSFGILSLSNNNRDAKVYVSVSNGSYCGLSTILLLHRQLFGKWEIIGDEGFARS